MVDFDEPKPKKPRKWSVTRLAYIFLVCCIALWAGLWYFMTH